MPDALVITDTQRLELQSYEAPPVPDGLVRGKTLASCLSPGTERRVYHGIEPGMPAFPLIPGYAACVEIDGKRYVSRGSKTTGPFNRCWGAHQSLHDADPDALVDVPEGVTDAAASFSVIASIAFHGTFSIDRPKQNVLVVGLGVIGQCSARILHAQGHHVTAVDMDAGRVDTAAAVGLDALVGLPGEGGFDAVVDATGALGVIERALPLLRRAPWGESPPTPPRYVVQGSYEADITLPYKNVFSSEATFCFPRDSGPFDMAEVLELIADGRLPVEDLFDVHAPSEAPQIYAHGPSRVTAVFQW